MHENMVICLPFAGAGASFFRAWQPLAPDSLRVVAVQLAGREERFVDEPHADVASAVDDVLPAVLEQIDGAGRIALFGHSLGAVLAFELARRLDRLGGLPLARLFVSGSPGPWSGRVSRATGLSDDAFLAQLHRFSGYSHPALDHPEMRAMLLPMLRADVEMHENYRPGTDRPLPIPVTALRGQDDELVSAGQAGQWADASTAGFRSVELPGGHMYLADQAGEVLRLLAGDLAAVGEGRA
ncbi:thioesterase II family protein [Amycolatopsis sp. NPDC059021]|uniref:thioesterase II family protein n=1 Tax=Amycolatopsis sp. NPDC059021 TaxID=3346704 RepID=UPI00366E7576